MVAVAALAVAIAASPALASHGTGLAHAPDQGSPAGHPLLAAAGSATDGKDGFERLQRANGIATIAAGGDTYAVVAAEGDNALQLIRISSSGILEPADTADNGTGGYLLASPDEVDTFAMGGEAFAIVAARGSDAVQLIRIDAAGTFDLNSSATHGSGDFRLAGPTSVDAFEMAGGQYAIAASNGAGGNGVQLIRIDPDGTLVANGSATNGGDFDRLYDMFDIEAFRIGEDAYAIAPSWGGNGVQLIRIHDNGTLVAADSATDGAGGFGELAGSAGVAAFEMDGRAYALVAGQSDNGVQLIRIDPDGTLVANGSATDGEDGFERLKGVYEVDAFAVGDRTYAVTVSVAESSVQLIRVHPDGTLEAAGSATDGRRGFSALNTPYEVRAFEMNGETFAVVASRWDHGVQLIRLVDAAAPPGVMFVTSPDSNGAYGTGRIVSVKVGFTAPVVVAGEPTLALDTEPPRSAAYRGGNGTDSLEFWYAVQPGDAAADLEYAGRSALQLPEGSSIRGVGGADANATLPFPGRSGSLGLAKNIEISAQPRPVLAAADSAANGTEFDLDQPKRVATIGVGGSTYAAVATERGDAVQLIRVHDNGMLEAAGSAADGGDYSLDRLLDIDTFATDNGTFAIVAVFGDNALQTIRIGADGSLSAAYSNSSSDAGFGELVGAEVVDAFEMGGRQHAIVGNSQSGGGIQLINIGADGSLSANDTANVGDMGFTNNNLIGWSYDIEAFEMGGRHYAAVPSYGNYSAAPPGYAGVQLVRIDPDGTLVGNGSIIDNGRLALDGASGLDTFDMGGEKYAIVASFVDNGVQLIRIDPDGTLVANGSATDADAGFEQLTEARAVDTFAMGGSMYAAVGARDSSAVQLIRINPDGTLKPAGSVVRGGGFDELLDPSGIDVFDAGGAKYAVVAAYGDEGVQLIRLSPTRVVGVASTATEGALDTRSSINITVAFDGNVTVAGEMPRLMLEAGGAGASAEYVTGSGTNTLVFRYTVRQGDASDRLDYTGTGALQTRGTITGAGGAAADLELPGPGTQGSLAASSVEVDGMSAEVLSVSSPDDDGIYGTGRIVAVEVEFSGPVAVAGAPALALGTDPPRSAEYRGGNGTSTLEFWYAVQPGDAAADLEYAGRSALMLPEGSSIRAAGGAGAITELPPAGSAASLGGSGNIGINGMLHPVLAAAGLAVDGAGEFDSLGGASGIDTVTAGGNTYAVVSAQADNAVQLVRIGAGGAPVAADSAANGTAEIDMLAGPEGVAAFEMGGEAFAIVAARGSDAVQLFRVHANGTLSAADSAANGTGGFDRLAGAAAIDTFAMGSATYAIVASQGGYGFDDDGIQLIRIHPNGTLSAADSAANGTAGFDLVHDVYDIEAFRMDGKQYAVAASWNGDGIQLIRIDADGTLVRNGSATNGTGGFTTLDGAIGVATLSMGNGTYAVVAAGGDGGGVPPNPGAVQLVRIHANGTLEAAGSATDGPGGFDELAAPHKADTFEIGGTAYAAVVSTSDNGIQLVRILANGTLEAAGSASDGDGGFDALASPSGVAAFESGGETYAAVSSRHDSGVQVIRMSPTRVESVGSATPDGAYLAGSEIDVRVRFSDAVAVGDGQAPRLLLGTGGVAEYASGSGTDTLVFRYAVRQGDMSAGLDYAGTGALQSRAAVAGAGGSPANLGLPEPGAAGSLAASSDIMVGTTEYPVLVVRQDGSASSVSGAGGAAIRVPDGTIPRLNVTVSTEGAEATFGPGTNFTGAGGDEAYTGEIRVAVASDARRAAAVGSLGDLGVANASGRIGIVFEVGAPDADIELDRPARIVLRDQPAPAAVYRMNSTNGTTPVPMCGDDADPAGWLAGAANSTLFCHTVPGGAADKKDYTVYTYLLSAFFTVAEREPDAPSPTAPSVAVLNVTSPDADDTYGVGSVINITVAFNGSVTVAGEPLLGMETGRVDRNATYAQGNGTAALAFRYEVRHGDNSTDLDYAGAGALSLNGGSILDAAGRPANLSLPEPGSAGSLSGSSDIVIDTVLTNTTRGTMTAVIVAGPQDPQTPVVQPTVVAPTGGGSFFGGGGGGGGGRGGGGGGGLLAPDGSGAVTLYGAAWDCDEGTIRITVNSGVSPAVTVLSSEGTVAAQRGDGPHPAGRTVYEAPLPEDPILSIRAVLADGRAVSTASEAVRTGGQCTGEAVFKEYGMPAAAQPAQPADRPDAAPPGEQPAPAPDPSGEAPPGEQQPAQPADPSGEAPPGEQAIEIPPPPADPSDEARDDAKTPPAEREEAAVPEAAQPDEDEGGCLVATAAHGTELAPQVQFLREVRDGTLLTTESGRAFMSAFGAAYYSFSPQVADLEREHPALRQAAAALLAPMLHALSVVGAAEPGSEHGVAAYGALAIAMVAGMYVAAPAAGAWYAVRLGRARRGGP